MADATIVQNATGKPLLALLRDKQGVLDLSIPASITVKLTHRRTQTTVTGTCTVVPWPDPLPDGSYPNCASYDWANGGDAEPGDVEAEWHLAYAGKTVVLPERGPLVLHVRKALV